MPQLRLYKVSSKTDSFAREILRVFPVGSTLSGGISRFLHPNDSLDKFIIGWRNGFVNEVICLTSIKIIVKVNTNTQFTQKSIHLLEKQNKFGGGEDGEISSESFKISYQVQK